MPSPTRAVALADTKAGDMRAAPLPGRERLRHRRDDDLTRAAVLALTESTGTGLEKTIEADMNLTQDMAVAA